MLKIAAITLSLGLASISLSGCSTPEERADSYYESGKKYLDQKDYAKAAIEFRNALKLKEDHANSWFGMAKVEENNKNWNLVAGDLTKALENNPKHLPARLALARFLLLAGDAPQALKHVIIATEQNPDDVEARVLKAATLLRSGDKAGAAAEAKAVLAKDPKNADAIVVLAAERADSKDGDGALKIVDDALKASPQAATVLFFKLQLLEKLGRPGEQEAVLLKLVELSPQDVSLRKALVGIYVKAKRNEDAERELRNIAAAQPEDAESSLNLVSFIASIKGDADAESELKRLIETGKAVWPYQSALAQLFVQQGHADKATAILDTVIGSKADTPDGIEAMLQKSGILVAAKQFDGADALIASALAKDSHNVEALRQKAEIRIAQGKLEESIEVLRQALNESPGNLQLHQLLGTVYERTGSIELADKEFSDGFRESSYNAAAGLSYAQFLLRRGNAERAETLLADVAEAAPNNVPALALLADLKLRKQDWQGAQVLAEAIKKAAGNSEISDQLTAASLAGQNRLDQSIEVLLNAKAAAPNLAQTKFALVRAYLKAGRAQEADQFLETVLSGDPSNVEALVLKGAVQVSLNKMDAAQENFEAAIAKDGKKTIGYRALADLYIKKDELEKAIETINAGLAAVPGNQDLKFALASVQEQQNKFDDAISTYRELLEINPGSMLAANNYASLVSDHQSDDPAALEKAASAAAILRGSPVPQFKDTLGWILHLRGDDKEARSLLEASTTQLPEQSLTNYHLGVVYLATGELDKAAEKLDLALKHAVNDNERSVATKALADLQAAKAKQP